MSRLTSKQKAKFRLAALKLALKSSRGEALVMSELSEKANDAYDYITKDTKEEKELDSVPLRVPAIVWNRPKYYDLITHDISQNRIEDLCGNRTPELLAKIK